MLKDVLHYILEMRKPTLTHVLGYNFTDKPLTLLMAPVIPKLKVDTLSAVVDYVKNVYPMEYGGPLDPPAGFQSTYNSPALFVQVSNPREVLVHKAARDGQRVLLLQAEQPSYCDWHWGQWRPVEEIIIELRKSFEETEGLAKLVGILSSITAENKEAVKDDGLSQKVTVRSGVKIEEQAVPGTFNLVLRDWWPELGPILHKCFLRIRAGASVSCAVYLISDPTREQRCMTAVADYLRGKLEGVTILV